MSEPLLRVRDVRKAYPGVQALRGVGFDVGAGHIHALLGENGAGKSTLIRILAGVEQPDAGTISLAGNEFRPASPLEALRRGVSTLYQEQNLLPDRSVSDNVLIGRQPVRAGLFTDRRAVRFATRDALAKVGAQHIDTDARVGSLSVADRQMVDIARALRRSAQLLIMDEPTAALSSREVDALFTVLASLPAQGVGVLFVSHRMDEIFRLCDAVTVLRDGEHIVTAPIGDLTSDDLIAAMVGESVRAELEPRVRQDGAGRTVLQARGLSGPGFRDVQLHVAAGEILSLAGVTGSGKEQLGMTLFGAVPTVRGILEVDGKRVRLTPRKAMRLGVVGVPADRKHEGVIGEMSVRRNLALPSLAGLSRFGFVGRRAERRLAGARVEELAIKIRDQNVLVAQLSGGNQQKVALGKWLEVRPRLLVLMEPTQGIDIKVRFEFYRLVRSLADGGAGVVLVSSDIPEVLTLADRALVLRGGRIVGELGAPDLNAENLVRLSLGQLSRDASQTLHTLDDAATRTGANR